METRSMGTPCFSLAPFTLELSSNLYPCHSFTLLVMAANQYSYRRCENLVCHFIGSKFCIFRVSSTEEDQKYIPLSKLTCER